MTNRSKDVGTRFTSDTIRYLRANGFPGAELRNQAGVRDKGDIIGCIGVCWECKGGHAAEQASDGQVAAWLLGETETERVNAGADVGILVTKRKAIGARFAGLWWAHMTIGTVVELVMGRGKSNRLPTWLSDAPIRMHLADAVMMLRRAGYGTEVGA
ncbi:hypothetical protein DDP54_15710 (plasmid) [Cellulomonas sp. WB94]|uniref:hypothetical protein n=1 Tax=Cellulomonas sp. WB94 TaxID=2173174 RepID=UPI000D5678EB|nr:hypothetical protein [Cellulomonas sp. WB94]PVU81346.1 hypothetical protein DDP54_15710 [Cellulomonas sp. WB94]